MKNLDLIAMLSMAFVASQAARPIHLDDYYRIEGASAAAISPDGKWRVFGRSMIVEAQNFEIRFPPRTAAKETAYRRRNP